MGKIRRSGGERAGMDSGSSAGKCRTMVSQPEEARDHYITPRTSPAVAIGCEYGVSQRPLG